MHALARPALVSSATALLAVAILTGCSSTSDPAPAPSATMSDAMMKESPSDAMMKESPSDDAMMKESPS